MHSSNLLKMSNKIFRRCDKKKDETPKLQSFNQPNSHRLLLSSPLKKIKPSPTLQDFLFISQTRFDVSIRIHFFPPGLVNQKIRWGVKI